MDQVLEDLIEFSRIVQQPGILTRAQAKADADEQLSGCLSKGIDEHTSSPAVGFIVSDCS